MTVTQRVNQDKLACRNAVANSAVATAIKTCLVRHFARFEAVSLATDNTIIQLTITRWELFSDCLGSREEYKQGDSRTTQVPAIVEESLHTFIQIWGQHTSAEFTTPKLRLETLHILAQRCPYDTAFRSGSVSLNTSAKRHSSIL